MVSATIDGKGSFDMVVDTAAESTIMTLAMAQTLGLAADGELDVVGVSGSDKAGLYRLGRIGNRLFDLKDASIPALPKIGDTEAPFILGMDLFAGRKLVLDRAAGQVRVEESGPASQGFVAVRGRVGGDTRLVIPLTINGVEIMGLVDSGAEGSVAGPDVRKALGWEAEDPRLKPYGLIGGATSGVAAVRVAEMEAIKIGPVRFGGVPIVFTNDPIAPLAGGPTMIIGIDLLNLLQAYAVDFARGELHIRLPSRGSVPASTASNK